jgi:LysM repeat protein
MGTGKGGASYYFGKSDGSKVKDKGNLNPFNPKLKGNSPENTFDFTQPATISNQTYTIQRGDNLSGIAKSHNTTVSNLAKINNISNIHKIYPDTVLNIK